MDLPFELPKYHKCNTKAQWKYRGLICSDEEFEAIYEIYITSTKCELCEKIYKSSRDRCMEHDHNTGKFRNIVCQRCNARKIDNKIKSNNTSGYKHISKQGFNWVFRVWINGEYPQKKSSVDKEEVIAFRDKWFQEHPDYHT